MESHLTQQPQQKAHDDGDHDNDDHDDHDDVDEHASEQAEHHELTHKILVTSPIAKGVSITQQYVCQIHSHRHIEVCALETDYLEKLPVSEGQTVKAGETMFTILPTLFNARLSAEKAEVQLVQIEFNNTEKRFQQNFVAQPEVALVQAKLAKARVYAMRVELNLDRMRAYKPSAADVMEALAGNN